MSQLVYPIDSGRTAVGLQLLPYTLDATVELVHKAKDPHSFGHERVPIGILCGEILRTCIAEQAAGINHLHPIPELVEPHRGSRLVIPVHAGVHNQFSQSQVRIIGHRGIPECSRNRNRTGFGNREVQELFNFRNN